jgi:hypothetical protein
MQLHIKVYSNVYFWNGAAFTTGQVLKIETVDKEKVYTVTTKGASYEVKKTDIHIVLLD